MNGLEKVKIIPAIQITLLGKSGQESDEVVYRRRWRWRGEKASWANPAPLCLPAEYSSRAGSILDGYKQQQSMKQEQKAASHLCGLFQ